MRSWPQRLTPPRAAAHLIERGVKGAWSRGEGPPVLGWLEALPEERSAEGPDC